MAAKSPFSSSRVAELYAGAEMQDIMIAIPGGVAAYKVRVSGLVHLKDAGLAISKLRRAVDSHMAADFELCRLHRDGRAIWTRVQAAAALRSTLSV